MAGSAHVFISYSNKDFAPISRLKDDLKRAGVVVWLDHEQLTPGTQNWTKAVREGIKQATDVVFAASPDAADSEYVGHELAIARDEGKRILPFWIRGEKWSRCTPMGYFYAQYVDGREAAYADGVAKLLPALGVDTSTLPVLMPQAYQSQLAMQPVDPPTYSSILVSGVGHKNPTVSPKPTYPLPDVLERLVFLGFRSVNFAGTPAILPPMVNIAAGPFLMGSDNRRDRDARDDEMPQHIVSLDAYKIGKYPVTVAEYSLAVHAGAVQEPPASWDLTWQAQLRRLDHPVVCVSWKDALAYAAWLCEVAGQSGWRLPSEAQWEKAARWDEQRGLSYVYPWGDIFDSDRCNSRMNDRSTTVPIGSYPVSDWQRSGASPYGAEDMVGNIEEWTSSLYTPYPVDSVDGGAGQEFAESRVLRGGSWRTNRLGLPAARRIQYQSRGTYDIIGFRLIQVH